MVIVEMPQFRTAPFWDGRLEIDFDRGVVSLDRVRLVLTRKEFELLSLLARNAGQVVPRDVLLMQVWGYSREIRTRTLDVHIRRLRSKLETVSRNYIETVFGLGYRFQAWVDPLAMAGAARPTYMALGA